MLQHQTSLDFDTSRAQASETPSLLIGCAGWSVSSGDKEVFPAQGSHLERYAAVFPAVEINSSFYRPHRPATYARWRDSVPPAFRFSVKLPRSITHQKRLRDADEELLVFLDESGNLGDKLGCLLVQLPPSLEFDEAIARTFLERLRTLAPPGTVDVACEPRHPTWFTESVASLLSDLRIARVRADPVVVPDAPHQRYEDLSYIRLHGSPVMYRSTYSEPVLESVARELAAIRDRGARAWCVFDNTADGAAIGNAVSVLTRIAAL